MPSAKVKEQPRRYYASQAEIGEILEKSAGPLTVFMIKEQLEKKLNAHVTEDMLKNQLQKGKDRDVFESPESGTWTNVK